LARKDIGGINELHVGLGVRFKSIEDIFDLGIRSSAGNARKWAGGSVQAGGVTKTGMQTHVG
jgi:hypothetical protein